MTDIQYITLKKERGRLLDAWRNADIVKKNSILMRITDIDEELEKYQKNNCISNERRYIRK
ncbi:MAG: hypothetical protein ACOYVD_14800 [Bacillota bacterium]